jgi:hypothetical protein
VPGPGPPAPRIWGGLSQILLLVRRVVASPPCPAALAYRFPAAPGLLAVYGETKAARARAPQRAGSPARERQGSPRSSVNPAVPSCAPSIGPQQGETKSGCRGPSHESRAPACHASGRASYGGSRLARSDASADAYGRSPSGIFRGQRQVLNVSLDGSSRAGKSAR